LRSRIRERIQVSYQSVSSTDVLEARTNSKKVTEKFSVQQIRTPEVREQRKRQRSEAPLDASAGDAQPSPAKKASIPLEGHYGAIVCSRGSSPPCFFLTGIFASGRKRKTSSQLHCCTKSHRSQGAGWHPQSERQALDLLRASFCVQARAAAPAPMQIPPQARRARRAPATERLSSLERSTRKIVEELEADKARCRALEHEVRWFFH
jgi:hypothetical protein